MKKMIISICFLMMISLTGCSTKAKSGEEVQKILDQMNWETEVTIAEFGHDLVIMIDGKRNFELTYNELGCSVSYSNIDKTRYIAVKYGSSRKIKEVAYNGNVINLRYLDKCVVHCIENKKR